jgi:methyl-accepting chemotaxis protein
VTPSERRKRGLIVEREFQFRFTMMLILIAGLCLFVFGGLLLWTIKLNFDSLVQNALLTMPQVVEELRRDHRMLSLVLLGCIVVMEAILIATGLMVTQKIAGPLLAFQKRLRDFRDGKKHVRLKLRKEDDFRMVEQSFNAAMEAHDNRMRGIRESLERVADRSDKELKQELQRICSTL